MKQLSKLSNTILKANLVLLTILFVAPVFGQEESKKQSFKSENIENVFTHRAVTPKEMTERANHHPYMNGEIVVAIELQESKSSAMVQVRKYEWSQLFGSNEVKPLTYLMTKELQPYQSVSLVHLSLPDDLNVFDAMNLLDGQPGVLWSSPNFYFEGDPREIVPNDPSYGSQYHHPLMQNDLAWNTTFGSSNIMLGITDDGVETTHSDLTTNIWVNPGEIAGNGIDDDNNGYIDDVNGWDFSGGNNDPNPNSTSYDHGTHVAGICAGRTNNSIGIAGVSGHSKILPIQFYGGGGSWTAAVCNASFTYAADNGANVVNTSYNINGFVGDPVFTAGMQYMHDNGVLHFNSGGNGSELNPARQAFHQTILVVNTDASDIKSSSSNWGTGMDISAPGSSIYSTVTSNGYGYKSGTSMAAPNAAGAAALIWSANPTWNSYQVAAQLLATADDIDPVNPSYAGLLGSGRVNTYQAMTSNIGAPIVKSLDGMPPEGSTVSPDAVDEFTVSFSQVMDPATVNNISNFEMNGAGPDGIYGNGDDVYYTLTTSTTYQLGTNSLTFQVTGPPFINGLHRLRLVSGGLANPHGTPLDGDENGTGGDDFIRNFIISLPAPVADFMATPTSPVPGADVIFTDLSTGSPSTWTWTITPTTFSFVNGTDANSQNPEVQFANLGYYTVTLDVSNVVGSDSETKVDYINVINCTYCASTYSNTSDDWITNVTFNTVNNTSGQGGSDSYEDFTSISTNVDLNQTYLLTVGIGVFNGTWTEHVWAWIDWNQNCLFDASEAYDLGDRNTSGTLSTNIAVPGTALAGPTRMRVIEQYSSDPDPCDSHPTSYGETEDYTIVVQSSSSTPVADFTADDTTPAVGQTVNFTDNSTNTPTSWNWAFSPTAITYVGGTSFTSQNPQVQFNSSGYYTVTLTATNTNGSDPETKTNYILAGTAGNWTGNTNTNWNLNTNWETLVVPTSTENVNIPASAPNWPTYTGNFELGTDCNNMTLEGSSQFTVTGNLTIPSGSVLTCNATATITIEGHYINNGTFNPGTGTFVFDGNTNAIIDAAGTISGSLQTTFAGGNGSNGNMFDIVALNDITITSFDANLNGGDNIVHVYNKTGTYVGSETNASAWTHIGSTTVTSGGNGSGTPIPIAVNISIPTGQTYAFFVYSELGNAYTNGSSAGSIYAQDANIQILEGCGKGAPLFTGGTYSPRVFNGIVHYSYGSGSGNVTFNNLVIGKNNAEVSNNVDIDINGDFTINPGAWFTNPSGNTINIGGDAILFGDDTGNASYIDQGTTTVTGSTLVQNYYIDNRWHFISSPVSDAVSNIFMDIYFKAWNEDTYLWEFITPTDYDLNPGQGFEIWSTLGNPIIDYVGGELNAGNINIPITATDRGGVTGIGTDEDEGWNFVGNPYPSAIDLGAPGNVLPGYTWTNLDYTVYLWNGAQYASYNPLTGASINSGTRYVPSMQSFFIRANDFNPGIMIPNSARIHTAQDNYKSTWEGQSIRLQVEGNGYSDEIFILTDDLATKEFDSKFDAYKMWGIDEAPQLYSVSSGFKFGVNVLPEILNEDVIPVGIRVGEVNEYVISLTELQQFENYEGVWLEDLKLGVIVDLLETPTYSFISEPVDDEQRFLIHFMYPQTPNSSNSEISIYSHNDMIFARSYGSPIETIEVYDMLGHKIINQENLNLDEAEAQMNSGMGYFLVKVFTNTSIKTEKVFIR